MMSFYKIYITLLLIVITTNSVHAVATKKVLPNPITIDSRIKTYVYSNNEIYSLVFNYGYQSYIEFSKGEAIKMMAIGDNTSWKVKPLANKLFIMPLEKHGRTNMLIETTKGRSYAFDLISISENESDGNKKASEPGYSELRDLAYIVRFYYPQSEEEFQSNKATISNVYTSNNTKVNKHVKIRPNLTISNYIIDKGNKISPTELFDDGNLTYFKFANNNQIIPQIFIYDSLGKMIPCKMLLLQGYIIIKGVHKNLYLQYKDKSAEIINKKL